MFTVALPGLLRVTPSGSEDVTIMRVKSSLVSSTSSLTTAMLNEALVCLAVNVTLYGPES